MKKVTMLLCLVFMFLSCQENENIKKGREIYMTYLKEIAAKGDGSNSLEIFSEKYEDKGNVIHWWVEFGTSFNGIMDTEKIFFTTSYNKVHTTMKIDDLEFDERMFLK